MDIIILSIFTAIFITLSILSFMQKAPFLIDMYFYLKKKDKKEFKTKGWYYYYGTGFLLVAIIFGITLIEEIFNFMSLNLIRWIVVIILILYTIIRYTQLESKRMKNKKYD